MPIPYILECRRILTQEETHYLMEWHVSLASAIDGMLDHQQRQWDSVELCPMAEGRTTLQEQRLVDAAGQQMTLPLEGM